MIQDLSILLKFNFYDKEAMSQYLTLELVKLNLQKDSIGEEPEAIKILN
jgi:hypothetical protein